MGRRRTDEAGRAYRKSQLQMQIYVNRRRSELDAGILAELPSLAVLNPTLEWVSPLERDRFREYYDRRFLLAVARPDLAPALKAWWPSGGPRWDALAVARNPEEESLGSVLVEAKSWPGEMKSKTHAKPQSLRTIRAALRDARNWLGVPDRFESVWLNELYQYGNRLAYLWWLREHRGESAWLVNVYIVGDPDAPTTRKRWEAALQSAEMRLGLAGVTVPHTARVFLPGRQREELFTGGWPVDREAPRRFRPSSG